MGARDPHCGAEHYTAYSRQRQNAKSRGIEFLLTYPEWLELWVVSGQIENRGKGAGQFCMSRHGDEGPYAVGNVAIVPAYKNLQEAVTRIKVRPASERGVYLTNPGQKKPWLARWGIRRLGMFATEIEARQARQAYVAIHGQPPRGLKAVAARALTPQEA